MAIPHIEEMLSYLPSFGILIVVLAVLKILARFAARRRLSGDYKRTLIPQFLVVAAAAVGLLFVILFLPISDATRGQVLGLLGVVFTGIIALSSTTFVTNAMAGLMLRLIHNYKAGDFIRVNDMFGRITERGLFHTEIQTPERDLTTFPNLYLINNPMTVVRSSGTIISAALSLGYDVSHRRIDPLLIQAAEQTGLTEPFVQVMELGDFSVSYKVSGFLSDPKQLLAMRSNLKRSVMDVLHAAGVEIVSPNFMNQRLLSKDAPVLPEVFYAAAGSTADSAGPPETLIFDKAEIAEERDRWRGRLEDLAKKRDALQKSKDKNKAEALERIETAIQQIETRIEKYNAMMDADEGKHESSK